MLLLYLGEMYKAKWARWKRKRERTGPRYSDAALTRYPSRRPVFISNELLAHHGRDRERESNIICTAIDDGDNDEERRVRGLYTLCSSMTAPGSDETLVQER